MKNINNYALIIILILFAVSMFLIFRKQPSISTENSKDVIVEANIETKREMTVEVVESGVIENVISISTEKINENTNQCIDDIFGKL